jgi:hypothetical protein
MSRPIYGVRNRDNDSCNCVPETPPSVSLTSFLGILASLRRVINKFYNPFMGVSQVIGIMTMSAKVAPPIFMRLKWIEDHPGTKFDKQNVGHRDDLQFVYNLYNQDWRNDPMFKAMGIK